MNKAIAVWIKRIREENTDETILERRWRRNHRSSESISYRIASKISQEITINEKRKFAWSSMRKRLCDQRSVFRYVWGQWHVWLAPRSYLSFNKTVWRMYKASQYHEIQISEFPLERLMELHILTVLCWLHYRRRIGGFFEKSKKPIKDQFQKNYKTKSTFFIHYRLGSGVTWRQIHWSSEWLVGET